MVLLMKYIGVSKNKDNPKSSILIGFSSIKNPFWGTPILENTHIYIYIYICVYLPCSEHFASENQCVEDEKSFLGSVVIIPTSTQHLSSNNHVKT